jgi:hypothetical protein
VRHFKHLVGVVVVVDRHGPVSDLKSPVLMLAVVEVLLVRRDVAQGYRVRVNGGTLYTFLRSPTVNGVGSSRCAVHEVTSALLPLLQA